MSDDDEKILEMVVSDGKGYEWRSRRVLTPDDVYGPPPDVVPEQDEFYEGGYYERPRPPSFQKSTNLSCISLKYGAFQMGIGHRSLDPTLSVVGDDGGLMPVRYRRRERFLRVELWYRNPNTGVVRLMGDCLPVEYITERDGVKAEHDFHDWQRSLGIPEHRIIRTMREAMKGTGRGPKKIEHVAELAPPPKQLPEGDPHE